MLLYASLHRLGIHLQFGPFASRTPQQGGALKDRPEPHHALPTMLRRNKTAGC